MALLQSRVEQTDDFARRRARIEQLVDELRARTATVAAGGGERSVERHRSRGKLLARDHQFVSNIEGESDACVLEAYLAGPYRLLDERAQELVLPFDIEEREVLEESLERTRIHVPQRGPRRELVEHAQQNARHLLEIDRQRHQRFLHRPDLVDMRGYQRGNGPVQPRQEYGRARHARWLELLRQAAVTGTEAADMCRRTADELMSGTR